MVKLIKIELPFAGFYESWHNQAIDDALQSQFRDDSGEVPGAVADIIWMADIDWTAIKTEYCKRFTEAFGSELELGLIFDEMTSPREYNFSTDRLFATIPAAQLHKIRREVEKHEAWPERIQDRFTSYDGFYSFYSNDYTDDVWTRPELDECQYEVLIGFWVEEVQGHNLTDLGIDLIEQVNAYEMDSIDDAAELVHAGIAEKLEKLRVELQAERISTGELLELAELAPYIEDGDVELLEAAGVPETVSADQTTLI